MSFNKFFAVPEVPKPTKKPDATILGPLQFKFAGKVYECIGDGCYFQFMQFEHLIETHDYVTLKNRIANQLKDHGDGQIYLKIIE